MEPQEGSKQNYPELPLWDTVLKTFCLFIRENERNAVGVVTPNQRDPRRPTGPESAVRLRSPRARSRTQASSAAATVCEQTERRVIGASSRLFLVLRIATELSSHTTLPSATWLLRKCFLLSAPPVL